MIRSFHLLPLAGLLTLVACGDGKKTTDHPPSSPRPASADVANQWKFEVKSGSFEMRSTYWPADSTTDSTGATTDSTAASTDSVTSTVIAYFDDYGSKMAAHWIVGPNDTMHTIINDGWVVNYDLKHGTGLRMKAPPQLRNGVPHLLDDLAMEEIGKRASYKNLGTREILGHEATGFSFDSLGTTSTVWQWKRIPLYMEGKGKVNIRYEITKLDVDTSIPASRFLPPNGLNLTDRDIQQGAAPAATPDTNGGPIAVPPSDARKK